MTDWDDDSEQLRANLHRLFADVRKDAVKRVKPTVELAREWQAKIMHRLTPPKPQYVGRFRGEPGLEGCEIGIFDGNGVLLDTGVPAGDVAKELKAFEGKLQRVVNKLDELIAPDHLSADIVAAVINLCAWIHSEWIRIHPFANGNGRTARIWANFMAMRYGLPPFVRLRPRPDGGYGNACAQAMKGQRQPMERVFRHMYREFIRR